MPNEDATEDASDDKSRITTQVAAETGKESTAPPSPSHRVRLIRESIAGVLAFLTIVTLLASTIGVWSHRTIFNTDAYLKVVTPLAKDPAVIQALSVELSDELMDVLEVQKRIGDALPEDFKFLSLPLSDAAHNEMQKLLVKAMETEQFQKAWVQANKFAHKTIVGALRNDLRYFDTSNGVVTLDLVLVAADVIRAVGEHISFIGSKIPIPPISSDASPAEVRQIVGGAIGITIPENFGQIVILRSDKLASAQRAVVMFDRLVVLMVILTLVLAIATVATSTRRWRMVGILGLGTVLAMVVAKAIINAIGNSVVSNISDQTLRGAVKSVFTTATSSLWSLGRLIAIVGLLLLATAFLVSNTKISVAIRHKVGQLFESVTGLRAHELPDSKVLRWIGEYSTPLRLGGLGLAVLILLLINVTWGTLLTVLVILGVYLLLITLLTPSLESDQTAVAVATEGSLGVTSDGDVIGRARAASVEAEPEAAESPPKKPARKKGGSQKSNEAGGGREAGKESEAEPDKSDGSDQKGDSASASTAPSWKKAADRFRGGGGRKRPRPGPTALLLLAIALAAVLLGRAIKR